MTASPPALFVGIDIAAKSLAAAWLRSGEAASRPITVAQSPQGFAALHERLGQTGCVPAEVHVVMEATGSYWIALATTLVHSGYRVSVINPAQAHHFAKALLKRAKTDAIDAQTLAQLAALLQPALWTPPPAVYYEVQQLHDLSDPRGGGRVRGLGAESLRIGHQCAGSAAHWPYRKRATADGALSRDAQCRAAQSRYQGVL